MLTIRACATPPPKVETTAPQRPMLPKRVARVRRAMESKRLDSFKEIHEALKKTAKEEQEFLKTFFDKTKTMLDSDSDEEL